MKRGLLMRLAWWACDVYSPSLALLSLPCRYTLRGALRGAFDRRFARDGVLTHEDRAALWCREMRRDVASYTSIMVDAPWEDA